MTVSDAFDDFPTSSTLLVTVDTDDDFYRQGRTAIERLENGDSVEDPDRFSFESVETLFETFNHRTMHLLETISAAEPDSIRETARLVDRDIKNVHDELTELNRLGLIRFEQSGRSKQPRFPYDEVVISLPFDRDGVHDSNPAMS